MPGCSDYPLSALLDPRSPAWIAVFCWMLAAGASARADTGDLPPTGRSLFDIITTAPTPEGPRLKVPYPFSRLRALILDKGGLGNGDIAETLIPIGRSLQREAAGPDYFSSPRRLLAVIAEPRTAAPETRPLLKDRLYLGYQPKAEAIEVISFNEDADRFEFQIVENYAPGKTPRVVQARRALCLACHGNGGPIFSKEPWSETPANPEVAARLAEAGALPSPDAAEHRHAAAALHRAVGGANRLLHASRYWSRTCTESKSRRACQTSILSTILEHRLAGRRLFGKGDYRTRRSTEIQLKAAQDLAWPSGFQMADPYLEDDVPLIAKDGETEARTSPLNQRPPLAVLDVTAPHGNDHVIGLLADAFSDRDIRWLDDALVTLARGLNVQQRIARVPCVFSPVTGSAAAEALAFTCSNRVPGFPKMTGRLIPRPVGPPTLSIDRLTIELVEYGIIKAEADTSHSADRDGGTAAFNPLDPETGLRPRTYDGWVIASIAMSWPKAGKGGGMAIFTSLNDIGRLHAAIGTVPGYRLPGTTRSVTEGGPRGQDIMRAIAVRLGRPIPDRCCRADPALPPPVGATMPASPAVAGLSREPGPAHPSLVAFHRACGACHAGSGQMPPNFLFGTSSRQLRAITACAPRILARLRQWEAGTRSPPPMPPPRHLEGIGQSPRDWLASADYRRVLRFTEALGKAAPKPGTETEATEPACPPVSR